ncbi:MAG: glycosyltransferase [Armatimonadota bacterium]
MKPASTLVLFTHAFPFGNSEPYLATELPYLAARFNRILLAPHQCEGERRSVPANVEVVTTLAALSTWSRIRHLLGALLTPELYAEIGAQGWKMLDIRRVLRALNHLGKARAVATWVEQQMLRGEIHATETLYYTYWLAFQTTGLMLLKRRCPELRVISRAHGWDIYLERHTPAYLPFRPHLLQGLAGIYVASRHGRQYLAAQYPELAEKCHIAILGVHDSGHLTPASDDGILRVVTCSSMYALKRVPLFVAGLAAFAHAAPTQTVYWDHFGSGEERERVEALAATLPEQIHVTLHGWVPNEAVLAFYHTHPIDAFVNVSLTEGGNPVSIMEAQSCGIPVIATAVGGTPEIVNDENGILLESDPAPMAIAGALMRAVDHRTEFETKRAASRRTWQRQANAAVNYTAFAARLAQFMEE